MSRTRIGPAAVLLAAVLAGCVPMSEEGSYYSDAGPQPETRFSAPDTSEPAEVAPETEDSAPALSLCEILVGQAEYAAEGGKPDIPGPYSVEYETEPDAWLEDLYGWHPQGYMYGYTLKVWPDLHESDEEVQFTVVHELGHAIDHECLGPDERQEWMDTRALAGEWFGEDPYTSPHEDLAESFAVCLTGLEEPWVVKTGDPPSPGQCQRLLGLVESGF